MRKTRDHKSEPGSQSNPQVDSGLAGLTILAGFYRVAADAEQLRHNLALGVGTSTGEDLLRAANLIGLKARLIKDVTPGRLGKIPYPALMELKAGGFVILAGEPKQDIIPVVDPITRITRPIPVSDLFGFSSGRLVQITRRLGGAGVNPKSFGFGWFIPSLWRYRLPLIHVVLSSLFLQLIALTTPLFFQLIVDKVLVHKGLSTLIVLIVGMATLAIFETILQQLRTYILNHTTNRIDVELGRRLFHHLFRLPLSYFETRPTGQTVARVRELENIRNFLTGQGLTSSLDLVFTLIFIAVMCLYSMKLTLIVVGSIPLYLVVALIVRPILGKQIEEKFDRGAQSQQFLVESILGAQTLKAASVEPMIQAQWEERLAAYVRTSFDAGMTGSLGQNIIQLITKLTTALVLFIGSQSVIEGTLTVGELIAFNMLAAQVVQPILRLSQLWQDFQQVQISVERLGDILNSPPEPMPQNLLTLPPPQGGIEFRNVSMRYRPDAANVLNKITLSIKPGEVIGFVGPSGSGKSTFAKLVQRLYSPQQGQVMLDGVDLNQLDPGWLRRQIGVVLQDNVLFNRSIHENIALAEPAMPRARVIQVARLAGADEFIAQLPQGYDTIIEERGANLSGGQRQRIAIARALATNPRILILDEATSALDYESERIIQNNMKDISAGRTVLIIAHRLAAVRLCTRIVGLKRGEIVEVGSHDELLTRENGLYQHLWRLQSNMAGVL